MDVRIAGVRVAGTDGGPVAVVVLEPEADRDDVVPIFVGFDEAASIVRGIDALDVGRPLSHDLLLDAIEELGGRITRVVVTAVEEGTFIADLHLDTPRDATVLDARPSDAMAMAARTGAPIEVADRVYEGTARDAAEFADLQDVREVIEDDR
jgi:bifunctional DNase/RNase